MGLFYDDKKILAANWLLKYLNKNHCLKISSAIPEYNGYRGDVVKIADLPTKYNYELLSQAADILSANGHINYVSQNHRRPEESKIHILESGRQAVLSSFYKKIYIKKWIKRVTVFFSIVLGTLGLLKLIEVLRSK